MMGWRRALSVSANNLCPVHPRLGTLPLCQNEWLPWGKSFRGMLWFHGFKVLVCAVGRLTPGSPGLVAAVGAASLRVGASKPVSP